MIKASGYYIFLIFVLILMTLLLSVWSLAAGYVDLSPAELWNSLWTDTEDPTRLILLEVRLPRMLLGLLVGGALGLSGAALQGLLRNPLAEPGLIGVSASGSLGAVIAIYTGLSAQFPYALPLLALAFSFGAVFMLHLLAGRTKSILTLILAGVALSSLAGALTSLTLNLSPDPWAVLEIVFWLMGSLTDRSMTHVELAAPFIIAGYSLLLLSGRALDGLSLGEDVAHSLGINLNRTRLLITVGTAASVGAATAVAGAVGFVGLIVPHLLRPLVGGRPAKLLPASMLGGACFILLADIVVREVLPGKDLKLGVVTALVGVPFFLWLLMKSRRYGQ